MHLTRSTFQPNPKKAQRGTLEALLRPGTWVVETAICPPHAHWPDLLLVGDTDQQAMAVSVGSAAALGLDLGPLLIERVATEDCRVPQLASLALHELVVNAVVHGNLEVSSGASSNWSDLAGRNQCIEEALADPVRAGRAVTVALGWNAARLLAVIADDGAGYQPSAPCAPAKVPPTAFGNGLRIARAAGQLEVVQGGRCARLTLARLDPSKSTRVG